MELCGMCTHVSAGACRVSLVLGLYMVVSCSSQVPGTELGSSARAVWTCNPWAISSAHSSRLKPVVLRIECRSVCFHGEHCTGWASRPLSLSDPGFYYIHSLYWPWTCFSSPFPALWAPGLYVCITMPSLLWVIISIVVVFSKMFLCVSLAVLELDL